jgi:arylsulfatase
MPGCPEQKRRQWRLGTKSLVLEPPVKTGTLDPYTPPKPGELRPESHLQIGPIIQYVTALAGSDGADPAHSLHHAIG